MLHTKTDCYTREEINEIGQSNSNLYTTFAINNALCKALTETNPDYKKALRELNENTFLGSPDVDTYIKTREYFANKIRNQNLPIKCDTASEIITLRYKISSFFFYHILLYGSQANYKKISLDDFESIFMDHDLCADFLLKIIKNKKHLSQYRALFSLQPIPYDKIKEAIVNKRIKAISEPNKDINIDTTQKEFNDLKEQVETLKTKLKAAEKKIKNLESNVEKLEQRTIDTNVHSPATTVYSPKKFHY